MKPGRAGGGYKRQGRYKRESHKSQERYKREVEADDGCRKRCLSPACYTLVSVAEPILN